MFGFGLTLWANGNYSQYVGLSENSKRLNNTDFICNFAIGMKVLRKMGEVQLTVNDAFNRNTGFLAFVELDVHAELAKTRS